MGRALLGLAQLLVLALGSGALGAVINVETAGVKADDMSLDQCIANTAVLNQTLAALQPYDVLYFPNSTFCFMGGIYARELKHNVIKIDGTMFFSDNQKVWPRDPSGQVHECILMDNLHNVTFTSSHQGLINGNGEAWWGAVKYLEIGENRPRLLHITNSSTLLFQYLFFKNSPYWNVLLDDVADVEIHDCRVDARRDNADFHDLYDMTAFNTDGFDVAGKNIYIHDVDIWNDDDCIAVKEQTGASHQSTCSENMLFERINASGVGLTIGSIGASDAHTCVRNITFRDSVMYDTFKGIYLKSRPSDNNGGSGEIRDVLYHNISIYRPTQWPIWIGPQQAGYADACSLLWPEDPLSKCFVPANMDWSNITLRDIYVEDAKMSPGVILGNETNPMTNIVFDNVVFKNPGSKPWGPDYYKCSAVNNGTATGKTWPVPPCFSS